MRWLLAVYDRVGDRELVLSHDTLADVLGVRRASVTVVLGRLRRERAIGYRRGRLTVLDRATLARHACGCYDVIRRALDVAFRAD